MKKSVLVAVSIGVVLVVLAGVGWWAVGITDLANFWPVMDAQYTNFKKIRPGLIDDVGLLPHSVFPVQPKVVQDEKRYMYVLAGKFASIDLARDTLYLEVESGETYGFHYQTNRAGEKLGYRVLDWEKVDYAINEAYPQQLVIYTNSAAQTASPFTKGEVLLIYWDDKRELGEVLSQAKGEPDRLINANYEAMVAQRIQRLWRQE